MRIKTFYIAARQQDQGQKLRALIQAIGHNVQASWLDATDYGTGKPYGGPERRADAWSCHLDITKCDELVMIANEGQRGGRHVELGIALGLQKLCHVIGVAENVFHSHPYVTMYPTVNKFLESL